MARKNAQPGLRDIRSVAILLLFPLAACVLRLAISSSMVSDESEQYLESGEFKLGYSNQPPLFNWAVFVVSRITGMGLLPIVMVKYLSLALFFAGFYLAVRRLASAPEALTVAASVLLIPQYSFKIIEDLTHTVTMVAVVSFTMWAFLRVLEKRRTGSYVLLGMLFGLGVLSKYNYVFFAAAATAAALIAKQHRHAVVHPKFLLSLVVAFLVFAPHGIWLLSGDSGTFAYIANRGDFGGLSLTGLGGTLVSSYWGGALYAAVVLLFFGKPVFRNDERDVYGFVRKTCVFALLLPGLVIIAGQTGFFKAKWLTSSLLCVPLAFLTMVPIPSFRTRRRSFNILLIVLSVSILLIRGVPGFFPDAVRSHGRELIPFGALSLRLDERVKDKGWVSQGIVLVADGKMTAANIMKDSSLGNYVILEENRPLTSEDHRLLTETSRAVLVWNTRNGRRAMPEIYRRFFPHADVASPLHEFYARSRKKEFIMGVAFSDRRERSLSSISAPGSSKNVLLGSTADGSR